MVRLIGLVLALMLSGVSLVSAVMPAQFTIVDLGDNEPRGLTPDGSSVVGRVGDQAAILYPAVVLLGSQGEALRSRGGVIAGFVTTVLGQRRAFRHSSADGLVLLPAVVNPPILPSSGLTVNAGGLIGGWAARSPGFDLPVLWRPGAATPEVLPIAAGRSGHVHIVNDLGDAAGWSVPSTTMYPVCTIWPAAGGQIECQTVRTAQFSYLLAYTSAGVGHGLLFTKRDGRHAFRWESSTGMTVLAEVGGLPNSEVVASNEDGTAVGRSFDGTTTSLATAWEGAAGTPINLNDRIPAGSGWVLEQALDIGQHNAVIGTGLLSGVRHGFLLLPAP